MRIEKEEDDEEPGFEPENQTICPNTDGDHQWIWDYENQDYFCDECGVYHEQQESEQ